MGEQCKVLTKGECAHCDLVPNALKGVRTNGMERRERAAKSMRMPWGIRSAGRLDQRRPASRMTRGRFTSRVGSGNTERMGVR